MAPTRPHEKRRARAGVLLWALLCLVAILPRSAGAFVLHAHEGHGLHLHLVTGLDNQVGSLDRDAFHARHHAHAHGEESGDPGHAHPHGDAEIFLGLPSDPVRACALPSTLPPVLERSAPFLALSAEAWIVHDANRPARTRPPKPGGRATRSGTRALLRTSPALRL